MVFKSIIGAICACLTVVSINVNAVVLNTLNGVDYEWLELTATTGMSRNQVEAELNDVNSALYGYEYASKSLVEELLLSYSSWDGLSGYHGASFVIEGMNRFTNDFGVTRTVSLSRQFGKSLVDGGSVMYDTVKYAFGYYGGSPDCNAGGLTCYGGTAISYNTGVSNSALQSKELGWSQDNPTLNVSANVVYSDIASFLVYGSPVPVPAAVWLFGSGIIGLIAVARRKV